jgi:predicted amidohydrolase
MLRVGIVQIDIRVGDREANRRNLEAHLERSLTPSEHPTAIVIPEIWDVGYDLERAKTVADPEGRSAAEFLGELARKYDVWFTGGSVLASSGGKFFNRAQVVNPSGELVTQYDKVHLIRLMDEHLHITPGSGLGLFDLGETKAGCVVCYDIRFCELLRTYALKGTEVLFVSAEWPLVRAAHWRALTIARAIENQMFVVACNRCGETRGTVFGGGSLVVSPWGEVLFEAGRGEEVAFVTIDPAKSGEVRKYLPVFADRAPEVYDL